MLVMVLSVRWTLPYLGEERFGVWMTIASFVGMLIFLDLGVGNALTNHVAMVAADGNKAPLTRTVSGGLGLLFLIGLVSSIMLCLVFRSLPWESIIKVRNPLINAEIQQALFFFSILFGVSIFTSGVQKIFCSGRLRLMPHQLLDRCFRSLCFGGQQEIMLTYQCCFLRPWVVNPLTDFCCCGC